MHHIIYLLSFISPFLLFASVLMMAIGAKGDPLNLALAGYGVLLMLFAALTFPRPGHPMFEMFARAKARLESRAAAKAASPQQSSADSALDQGTSVDVLQEMVDVNMPAVAFEAKPTPYHEGWSRLDLVVGHVEKPSSWIGGLPEMPQDIDWPVTNGKAAMFLAQIAMADLPQTIWGGMAPKSGWLLFFVAPQDWGGLRVIHIENRGAPRAYPNGASIENYLSYDASEAMQGLGRANDPLRPPKFALTVTSTDTNPPNIFQQLEKRDEVWGKYRALEITDPGLKPFAVGPNPSHVSTQMLALQSYLDNPNALTPDVREVLENLWTFQASIEAATMGGPVDSEFYYDAPEEPVALLRIPSSKLLGWSFGDSSSLGVFIAPKDLKAHLWDKAWFRISN